MVKPFKLTPVEVEEVWGRWRSGQAVKVLARHNVPLHVVSRNLGHSSIAITGDVYGHLTDEAAQVEAEAVSRALGL